MPENNIGCYACAAEILQIPYDMCAEDYGEAITVRCMRCGGEFIVDLEEGGENE